MTVTDAPQRRNTAIGTGDQESDRPDSETIDESATGRRSRSSSDEPTV